MSLYFSSEKICVGSLSHFSTVGLYTQVYLHVFHHGLSLMTHYRLFVCNLEASIAYDLGGREGSP